MAKRKKLKAPSAADLSALGAEFRSETRTRPNPATAPICQIASEAAQASRLDDAQARLDAERLRSAQEQGLLITEIATTDIVTNQMIRDRTVLDADEPTELQISIRANGLRQPIEVYKDGDGYALLSGYRRLLAVRNLAELNPGNYTTIKALIRPATDTAGAFAAMVEENEIRANLSHYERGRIAAIAAQKGAFESTETAVNILFNSASKSKRSKVRSFVGVFEMMGDLLATY
ncbi:MAG: ParB family chromosome partitioning protein [Yoonia sp.]|jgi:ParB family chromosome partitioning protein